LFPCKNQLQEWPQDGHICPHAAKYW
jgi:hypothetical protein